MFISNKTVSYLPFSQPAICPLSTFSTAAGKKRMVLEFPSPGGRYFQTGGLSLLWMVSSIYNPQFSYYRGDGPRHHFIVPWYYGSLLTGLLAFILAASTSIVSYQLEWSLKSRDHNTLPSIPPHGLKPSNGLLSHLITKYLNCLSQSTKHHITWPLPACLTSSYPQSSSHSAFLSVF